MNICFLGVDGSGKTTLASELKKELKKSGFRRVIVISTRRFTISIILPVILLSGKILGLNIICDRSYYDFIFRTFSYKFGSKILSFIPDFFDFKFFLYADADIIYNRKPEHSTDILQKQHGIFDQVASNYGFIKINTECNIKDSLKQILKNILERKENFNKRNKNI